MRTSNKKDESPSGMRPALSPEAREKQMISLAVNLAEQRLIDGSASSTLVLHYLKLANEREKLVRQKLEEENKLLRTKTEAIQAAKDSNTMYENALKAMKEYSGFSDETVIY